MFPLCQVDCIETWQNQKIKYTLLSSMAFIHCCHMFCWNMISWENVTCCPWFSPIRYSDIILYMFSLKCQIKFNQRFNLRMHPIILNTPNRLSLGNINIFMISVKGKTTLGDHMAITMASFAPEGYPQIIQRLTIHKLPSLNNNLCC